MVQGDKVKFSLQFRGREMQFQEEGSKMFQVCIHHCEDLDTSSVMPCISANALREVVCELGSVLLLGAIRLCLLSDCCCSLSTYE